MLSLLNCAKGAISSVDMSDAVLCKILMTRLPQEVQATFSIIFGCLMDEFAKAADRATSKFWGQFVGTTRPNFQIQQLDQIFKKLKMLNLKYNTLFPKIFGRNVQINLSRGTFSRTMIVFRFILEIKT